MGPALPPKPPTPQRTYQRPSFAQRLGNSDAPPLHGRLGFDIRSPHPKSASHTLALCRLLHLALMATTRVLLCAFVVLLILTPCTAARALRGHHGGRRLSPSVRRTMKSGDDAVPTAAKVADYESKYNEWVHFQAEQLAADYPPTAANPSVPCCSP